MRLTSEDCGHLLQLEHWQCAVRIAARQSTLSPASRRSIALPYLEASAVDTSKSVADQRSKGVIASSGKREGIPAIQQTGRE